MKKILGVCILDDEEKDVLKMALEHLEAAVWTKVNTFRTEREWLRPLEAGKMERYNKLSNEIAACERVGRIIKEIKL